MKRTLFSLLLTVCLLLCAVLPAFAADKPYEVILHEALQQLSENNRSPELTPIGGDWTVFTLARSGMLAPDDPVATGYYARVVPAVDAAVRRTTRQDGALHDLKSTDNARIILALTAIGKDPHHVGAWDLLQPYGDFSWIRKQGINAAAYALLALNSHAYETADPGVRAQCRSYLLDMQFEDGGWAIIGSRGDVDITAIVLQALGAYQDDPAVADAIERGFAFLSAAQKENGAFATIGTETTESAAQVILACAACGVDPATDARLCKNGVTPVDCLLRAYRPEAHAFAHTQDNDRPAMQATEQACYALLAYERFQNGQPFLFDCTDVPLTADPAVPEPETETTESAESTKETTKAAVPAETTEASAVTAQPTEPATEGSGDSTKETTAEKKTTAPATTQAAAPRPAATTAPPAPTADRTEATPHTGDDPAVFAAIGLLALSAAALVLSRKKEARHAS